jgi:uncharacterized protein YkwD
MIASIVAAALMIGFVDAGKTDSAKTLGLYPIESHLIERTNAERTRRGLPALEVDLNLVKSAREHAAWMTRNHTLRHTHRAVAENIAMGQSDSAEAMRSWMSSSGHRANILRGSYTRIGVAAYTTPDGTIYWCQQFE